jgi:hypothetical protein
METLLGLIAHAVRCSGHASQTHRGLLAMRALSPMQFDAVAMRARHTGDCWPCGPYRPCSFMHTHAGCYMGAWALWDAWDRFGFDACAAWAHGGTRCSIIKAGGRGPCERGSSGPHVTCTRNRTRGTCEGAWQTHGSVRGQRTGHGLDRRSIDTLLIQRWSVLIGSDDLLIPY